ncbi:hypothetical protein C173_04816 [Paenibacillus sp. FSL R7-277]|uniref:hypothetical protein n=1 Tax=unclassified Paenibacillus TaxID=185978 RepID=UPI0003E2755B|nr:hypothetical protein [Paenibacillus sp. FSL R7-277]ETT77133.1 hypothetical protein C173_04816 [Paenibacillus sp. FSL R7-277]
MYIVSEPKGLSEHHRHMLEAENAGLYPPAYIRFLQQYGEGTYRGWMNVQTPDTEVLRPFAEYGLWEHDQDSPITEQQIGECTAIGTTVDGDFLAVHPKVDGLLWLPRHAEQIQAIPLPAGGQEKDESYAMILDGIYRRMYGRSQEESVYYEPWTGTREHLFLRMPPGEGPLALTELADLCRAEAPPDLFIENPYVCYLFYRNLGGYIRLNLAGGQEVAVFYEQAAGQASAKMKEWLLSKGCEQYSWE